MKTKIKTHITHVKTNFYKILFYFLVAMFLDLFFHYQVYSSVIAISNIQGGTATGVLVAEAKTNATTTPATAEPSMQEWVILEAISRGLDPYEVWAIIQCESGWNDQATYVNTDDSIDRGLMQINSKWHKEVDNACAYDYKCNINEGMNIRVRNGSWNEWACSKKLGIK